MPSTKDLFGVPKYSPFEKLNDWTSGYVTQFVLSPSLGTCTDVHIVCRRDMDCLSVRGYFVTGTTTASPLGYIQLPSGFHIDTSKILISTAQITNNTEGQCTSKVGTYTELPQASTPTPAKGAMIADGIFSVNKVYFAFSDAGGLMLSQGGNSLFSSGDGVEFSFSVPVKEFSL